MTDTTGIIVFADTEPDYIEQAKLLALTAKKFSGLPTTLITTEPIEAEEFDGVIIVPEHFTERGMITAMLASPYDRTAFIYADTLVLSDITQHFDLLDHHDMIFPFAVDYKNAKLSSDLYNDRKLITKNELPDLWTNYFLFKKTPTIQEIAGLMYIVVDHWAEIKESACPAYSDDKDLYIIFNILLSIALKLRQQEFRDYGLTFTHMSKQTNNTENIDLAFKDWFNLLSFWATDDGHIKAGDYKQTGVWHYSRAFYSKEFDTSIRKLCSN